MKQNVLQIAGAFFLAVCAMILVTAFAQWPYIAIVGCIFAAAGAYCLYRGLYGLFGIMEQDRSEDHRFFQEQQDRLVRVITDLNKVMQMLLIGNGYSCGPSGPDGKFGPATKKAVGEYQEDHKDTDGKPLTVDYICGPKMWGSLLKQ